LKREKENNSDSIQILPYNVTVKGCSMRYPNGGEKKNLKEKKRCATFSNEMKIDQKKTPPQKNANSMLNPQGRFSHPFPCWKALKRKTMIRLTKMRYTEKRL